MKRPILALAAVVGLAAGLAGGLLYTWVLDPVEYYDTAPDTLWAEDRIIYLALIGDLYVYEEDLDGAKARLTELGVKADGQVLMDHIERYLDGGGQPDQVRNLARLAEDLGGSGGVLLVFAAEPTPSPTIMPSPEVLAGTALPTPRPPLTPVPSFQLLEQTALCAKPDQPGEILVWVQDAASNELSGVEVVVSWSTGEDRFYTGLRPEQGIGYADFEMSPRTEYEVALAGFGGDTAQGLSSDLTSGTCPTGTVALSWRLIFQQTQE